MLCGDEPPDAAPRARARTAPAPTVRRAGQLAETPHDAHASRSSPWSSRWSRWASPRGGRRPGRQLVPGGVLGHDAQGRDLPAGCTLSASQYDINRQQMTFLGPAPADETTAQGVVYVTVTCFAEGAADAVTRSEQAATDAGQTVTDARRPRRPAFAATDESGLEVHPAAPRRRRRVPRRLRRRQPDGGRHDRLRVRQGARRRRGRGRGRDRRTPAPRREPSDAGASPSGAGEEPSSRGRARRSRRRCRPRSATRAAVDSAPAPTCSATTRAAARSPPRCARRARRRRTCCRPGVRRDAAPRPVDHRARGRRHGREGDARSCSTPGSRRSGAGVTRDAGDLGGRDVTRIDYGDGGALDYVLARRRRRSSSSPADEAVAAEALKALP